MHPKQFARVGGTLLILLGLFALLPSLSTVTDDLPPLALDNSYGLFLNSIPFNIVNKVVLIVLGSLGILSTLSSTRSLPMAIGWSRLVCLISAVTLVLGLMPSTNTLYGYMPLFGGDVVFHAVLGIIAGYFGFALTSKAAHKIEPLAQAKKDEENFRRKAG